MTSKSTFTNLQKLSEIISSGLSTLQETSPHLPDLTQFSFDPATEAFRANPQAAEAARLVADAGLQLAMSLLSPPEALIYLMSGVFRSAALRVAVESNVTEILREAGPEGLHADRIGEKAGIDGDTLARLLRVLATNHVYREVKPDVFTNNRISGTLDTGKKVEDIKANPSTKYEGTSGLAALVCHCLDEGFKSTAYVYECLSDSSNPRTSREVKPAFQYAFKENANIWKWYEKAENAYRLNRFGIAMQGVTTLQPPDSAAFELETLPSGSVVVDVGGGVGSCSLPLAEKQKHVKIVIQDRPAVVEEAKKACCYLTQSRCTGNDSVDTQTWMERQPDALSTGRVTLQAHDFFDPQPVKAPAVYLLKQILHDWTDVYCVDILKQLRNAAGKDTKLIVLDDLLTYACPVDQSDIKIPGAIQPMAPEPLLANGGAALVGMPQATDLLMLAFFNAQGRTILHLQKLLRTAGWEITKVRRVPARLDTGFVLPVEAVPIFD